MLAHMAEQSEKRVPRVHTEADLSEGAEAALEQAPSHYLRNVLRLAAGDGVALFNGSDGEWACVIIEAGKRACRVRCGRRTAVPQLPPDIDYLFAPLKAARLDYLAQKATEMGVRRLRPVITERTVPQRLNLQRLKANAIEAAEQCNLVFVPEVLAPVQLGEALATLEPGRRVVHCDEALPAADPLATLANLAPGPLAALLGPEGGFTPREQAMLREHPAVTPVSLGPRIMRADTAAVAILALVQARLGDWRPQAAHKD
jgi:16S rRNA (uracil1498-N3)-methyltransferase